MGKYKIKQSIENQIKLTDKTQIQHYNSFVFSILLTQSPSKTFDFLSMITNTKISKTASTAKDKSPNFQKTTSQDEDKKYKLIKKLTSHSSDQFRQLDIDQFDLNFTQHFEELQYIDDAVTPLIYCAHYGLKEICKFLLKNKTIDVDQETLINKQTALIVACMNGNYQIVRHLILASAQVNKPNSLNNNPLAAVLYRLVQENYSFQNKKICFLIAELLIKNGADPNWIIQKTRGFSLLHYFCASKMKMNKMQKMINQEIISFLLNHGANPQLKTLKDQNAFDLVKSHCNRENIEILLNEHSQKNAQKKRESMELQSKKTKYFTEKFMQIQIKPKKETQSVQSKSSKVNQDSIDEQKIENH